MAKFFNNMLAMGTAKTAVYSFKNTVEEAGSEPAIKVEHKSGGVASWGVNNKYPQEILEAISKNGTAKAGLRFNIKTHYGNGLVLFKENYQQGETKKRLEPLSLNSYPEVKAFFKKSQMPRFSKETIADLETFAIAFPEYILSADYKKITRVKRQRSAWCRFELMNPESKLVENVYISEMWAKGAVDLEGEYVAKVPLVDSYWSAEEVREYCKKNTIHKFIRPIYYPLINEAYYPVADWHTVKTSGWLDVANSIPEYKKAMFENQISIKYLVEIDERYFEKVYGDDWESFSVDDRKEKRKEVINAIDEHLGGNKNAGKSILSMKIDIPGSDQTVPAISITPIDDKFKDGAYLPEASAANSEIAFALGVDPSVIGAGIPGGKLGAGSGSDKREAFLIASALSKTNRETSLEPYQFIQDFNGWPEEISFSFENTILTTLDKNPTGKQNAIN